MHGEFGNQIRNLETKVKSNEQIMETNISSTNNYITQIETQLSTVETIVQIVKGNQDYHVVYNFISSVPTVRPSNAYKYVIMPNTNPLYQIASWKEESQTWNYSDIERPLIVYNLNTSTTMLYNGSNWSTINNGTSTSQNSLPYYQADDTVGGTVVDVKPSWSELFFVPKYNSDASIFTSSTLNNYITVTQPGTYLLSVNVGFYINVGTSTVSTSIRYIERNIGDANYVLPTGSMNSCFNMGKSVSATSCTLQMIIQVSSIGKEMKIEAQSSNSNSTVVTIPKSTRLILIKIG